MRGIADGFGRAVEDVIAANFIPEMFHCSGFALSGSATKDGTLYHGRILDYGCDWKLQEHAVLVVAEPEGKIPFVNVTYAGFIGSVTGMNAEKVSIGEMGGGAWATGTACRWPSWSGWRWKRRTTSTRPSPSSATTRGPASISTWSPTARPARRSAWRRRGTTSPRSMGESEPNCRTPSRTPSSSRRATGTRSWPAGSRPGHGTFDAESARHLMDRPVAMKSNLHSVLFETTTTRFWVANASNDGQPAANQPYHAFQLSELLTHKPDPSAPSLGTEHLETSGR